MITFIFDFILIFFTLKFILAIALLLLRAYTDKIHDETLNINTRGKRAWDKKGIYHRTESTPYLALNSLTEEYKVDKGDQLVDFGAGKGRVFIYLHHIYKIPVTGIELNELAFNEAKENVQSYSEQSNLIAVLKRIVPGGQESKNRMANFEIVDGNKDISVIKEYAEEFRIDCNDNKFFFFNPFDVSIFEKVVHNIIKHSDETGKEVDIILYYPTRKYKKFLKSTEFALHKRIKTVGAISPTEKIEIYRYKKG